MPLIFLHIPKTAGTSVRMGLERFLNKKKIIRVWDTRWGAHVDADKFSEYQIQDDWDFITGHLTVKNILNNEKINRKDARITILSFVRDPIDRMISLYNYRRLNPHFVKTYLEGEKENPSVFFRSIPRNEQMNFLSTNIRDLSWSIYISPIDEVSKTCASIVRHTFGMEANESDFLIRENVSLNYSKTESKEDVLRREDIHRDVIAELIEHHADDIALYNQAKLLKRIHKFPTADL